MEFKERLSTPQRPYHPTIFLSPPESRDVTWLGPASPGQPRKIVPNSSFSLGPCCSWRPNSSSRSPLPSDSIQPTSSSSSSPRPRPPSPPPTPRSNTALLYRALESAGSKTLATTPGAPRDLWVPAAPSGSPETPEVRIEVPQQAGGAHRLGEFLRMQRECKGECKGCPGRERVCSTSEREMESHNRRV